MKSNINHRRSIRIPGYDYRQAGGYFVTVCTRNKQCLFGEIVDGGMRLNEMGEISERCWQDIPDHFRHVDLDSFVVMPNHIHGIIIIHSSNAVGARHAVPLHMEQFGKPVSGAISTIIRSFKSAATACFNRMYGTTGNHVWQRNYYEHVIRNERDLSQIREYVINNPKQWELDRENPVNISARYDTPLPDNLHRRQIHHDI